MYLHAIGVESVYAITVGNNGKREELAVQLGAKEVFNLTKMGTQVITDRLQKENGGLGVDLCVEASGVPQAVPQGMEIYAIVVYIWFRAVTATAEVLKYNRR